ncbi:MAG: GMC family oxidoreductase [Sandaracinaceae bacterium]|nr:GMC family oxidoreductase [Sandaracinaceae bacterium]
MKLTPDERWLLLQIAEAATPAGAILPLPDGRTIDAVEEIVRHFPPGGSGYSALLTALDLASVPIEGERLSKLPLDRRIRALEKLNETEGTHWLVRVTTAPLKIARAEEPHLAKTLGISTPRGLPVAVETPRWTERMTDARALEHDEELEVDVVIVGTGAGGAPLARNLAARGHAVLMLEEGAYFSRKDFNGRPIEMQRKLYREHGLTMAMGNAFIPVPIGRTVGGTTTVNSGTCYRTPDDVLRRWQLENGLHELGPGSLERYFERVEQVLEIAASPPAVLGGVARVIARGCDALGYAHAPLKRNAPGCDAQALCCFGCPTDAKRSTNVSYVPLALGEGAMLMHHARVEHVLVENGRAVGVEACAVPMNGKRRRIAVRAKSVVLACGALHTPSLLLRNGLANSSDQVGRNLTIHPAGYSWARFAESIRGWEEVPQGYAIEEFVDQNIRFEGGFLPISLAGGAYTYIGPRWTELIEDYDNLACFGFMIRETSRGRVVPGVTGSEPRVTYRVNDADLRTLVQAQATLARVYLAAGAEVVFPGVQKIEGLRTTADIEQFEREAPSTLRPHHHDLSAYHPLGTCRMGSDPRRSVIGPSHETHDVESLFVVDGSAVPGPLGVNPQVTIMALSERATQYVEERIERPSRGRVMGKPIRMGFDETMAGTLVLNEREIPAEFTVRARTAVGLAKSLIERGSTFALEGTVTIEGIVTAGACQGSLRMRPLARKANVVYDLSFSGDDGARHTLHGEKHAPLLAPSGMTRLFTELRREGELVGKGLLLFNLRDLPPWLRSFTLEREAS